MRNWLQRSQSQIEVNANDEVDRGRYHISQKVFRSITRETIFLISRKFSSNRSNVSILFCDIRKKKRRDTPQNIG
jgi:hypothetical protein